jgi:hypothetical protein
MKDGGREGIFLRVGVMIITSIPEPYDRRKISEIS